MTTQLAEAAAFGGVDVLADALGHLFCIVSVCFLLVGLSVLGVVIYRDVFLYRGGVNTGTEIFEAAMVIIIGRICRRCGSAVGFALGKNEMKP